MKLGIGILTSIIALAFVTGHRSASEESPESRLITSTMSTYGARLLPASGEQTRLAAQKSTLILTNAAVIDLAPDQPTGKANQSNKKQSQAELALALHQELKRVGCYKGDIGAEWNAKSQTAMKAFNERINATLPVGQPDFILLTMVSGHKDQACGAPCMTGEVLTAQNKCMPAAVVANARPAIATPAAQVVPQVVAAKKKPASDDRSNSDTGARTKTVARTNPPKKTATRRVAEAPRKPAAAIIAADNFRSGLTGGLTRPPQRIATVRRAPVESKTVFERMNKT